MRMTSQTAATRPRRHAIATLIIASVFLAADIAWSCVQDSWPVTRLIVMVAVAVPIASSVMYLAANRQRFRPL